MPITITLARTAPDRAEAHVDGQVLATFEPAALLVDQLLFSEHAVSTEPVSNASAFAALSD
jgi:hypothetical protein